MSGIPEPVSGIRTPPPSATLGPWAGGEITTRATCVLAPNPGPMTLDGTNTWVLLEPGGEHALVVDPGPADEAHLRAICDLVASRGARVTTTVLTHGHADHAEGAPRFAQLTGAPTVALGDGHDDLDDGSVLTAGDLVVRVIATAGHTSDSLSLVLESDHALLTGDTVLGRGTTVVAHPDGELAAYLGSLERIRALTGSGGRLLSGSSAGAARSGPSGARRWRGRGGRSGRGGAAAAVCGGAGQRMASRAPVDPRANRVSAPPLTGRLARRVAPSRARCEVAQTRVDRGWSSRRKAVWAGAARVVSRRSAGAGG